MKNYQASKYYYKTIKDIHYLLYESQRYKIVLLYSMEPKVISTRIHKILIREDFFKDLYDMFNDFIEKYFTIMYFFRNGIAFINAKEQYKKRINIFMNKNKICYDLQNYIFAFII